MQTVIPLYYILIFVILSFFFFKELWSLAMAPSLCHWDMEPWAGRGGTQYQSVTVYRESVEWQGQGGETSINGMSAVQRSELGSSIDVLPLNTGCCLR